MNDDKFCINRSVFLIFVFVFSIFFVLAFYQKVINTVITRNNQAAVRKQQTAVCSYKVREGDGSIIALKVLGIDTTSPPIGFKYVNLDGKLTEIYKTSIRFLPLIFTPGNIVSLIPKDHIKIPCQGEYLGNVWQQQFDDATVRFILNGYYSHTSGFQNPITADIIETKLKNLCEQQWWKITPESHPDRNLSLQDMGCNFVTVVKTAQTGGQTTCRAYDTTSQVYEVFQADPNLQQLKWYSIAMLGKKTRCYPDNSTPTQTCYKGIVDGQLITSDLAQYLLCRITKEGKNK
ncbi:MAG: hypothetical protein AAB437_04860 [Patescibacteria group bacterium]